MLRRLELSAIGSFAWIALTVNSVQATPIFNVVAGQCPNNPAVCTATNGVVRSTLFNIFLINPLKDTTGAYANLFTPAFNSWNSSLAMRLRNSGIV